MTKKKQIEETKEIAVASMELLSKLNFAVKLMRLNEEGIMADGEKEQGGIRTIIKIEFPEEGGVLTHYAELKYPAKGFFYKDAVERVDITKKIFTLWFSHIDRLWKTNKIKTLLGIFLFRKQFIELIDGLFETAVWLLSPQRLKPNKYCTFVREIYRTFDKINIENKVGLENLRDVICVFLEFDDAYRYRIQDAFSEFKIKKDNPNMMWYPFINMPIIISDDDKIIEEIQRILNILNERELCEHMKMRWRVIKHLFTLLKFFPKAKKNIIEFFKTLDINKIRLSVEDKYHATVKSSYNWRMPEYYDEEENKKEKKEGNKDSKN